jgi:hypothetical protein
VIGIEHGINQRGRGAETPDSPSKLLLLSFLSFFFFPFFFFLCFLSIGAWGGAPRLVSVPGPCGICEKCTPVYTFCFFFLGSFQKGAAWSES